MYGHSRHTIYEESRRRLDAHFSCSLLTYPCWLASSSLLFSVLVLQVVYDGEWADDKKHGRGIHAYNDGNK